MAEHKDFQHLEYSEKSLPREFWDYMKVRKKFWLLPIIVILMLLALFIVLGGTAAAPFIYTLF